MHNMMHNVIWSTFCIVCLMIVNQTSNGGFALPSIPAYLPTKSTVNWTKNGHDDERMYREGINNAEKNFERLKFIPAEHYKRKAVFFEKELEICLAEIEKCQLTMKDLENLKDHFVSQAALQMETPHSHSSTTTENSHGSLTVVQMSNQNITKEEISDSEESSQNRKIIDLTEELELEKKRLLLIIDFIERGLTFRDEDVIGYFTNADQFYHSFNERVIKVVEKHYESHLPKVIEYKDVAKKMRESLNGKEILFADLILAKMEDLNLIQRNQEPGKKSSIPQDIQEKVITPRSVRWMLFMLVGQHPTLLPLRSTIKNENPDLGLYEFCWIISRLGNKGDKAAAEQREDSIMTFLDIMFTLNNIRLKLEDLGPVLRSIILLIELDKFKDY